MKHTMKFIVILLLLSSVLLGSVQFSVAEHNEEFAENGCDTADQTIEITTSGEELVFYINDEANPEIQVDSGACVKVIFDNAGDLDHDFTVVDDVTDEDNPEELIHMDTPAGNTTEHLWQMPERDVTLEYFCEVPGHEASGMKGVFVLGSGSSSLSGFGWSPALLGMLVLVAIPIMRRRS